MGDVQQDTGCHHFCKEMNSTCLHHDIALVLFYKEFFNTVFHSTLYTLIEKLF